MSPRYPLLWRLLLPLSAATLRRQRRSFRREAQACTARLRPPMQILGSENIPPTGPCLVTVNHYARPGFRAWWIALGISASLPYEVHWIITSAWTYPDLLRRRSLTPATRWILQRIAARYDFSLMPPMPPDPAEAQARADAVRRVLRYAHSRPYPVIGLAPEGRDPADGRLGQPPPGVGRFIALLSELGLPILPVGVYEAPDRFCLNFGPLYPLELPPGLTPESRDQLSSRQVMLAIARLLPPILQKSEIQG